MQNLSEKVASTTHTNTCIDWNCLSEPERELFVKVQEIISKYAPAMPPKDVVEKNADLWYKSLEIFAEEPLNCLLRLFLTRFVVMSWKIGISKCISIIFGKTGWKA
jgi:hypothetical protein